MCVGAYCVLCVWGTLSKAEEALQQSNGGSGCTARVGLSLGLVVVGQNSGERERERERERCVREREIECVCVSTCLRQ